ncbi:MAG TPA: hypothetical protein VE449_09070 [Thermoleophilaceae bacterium]|nr:hypothetical protein [Thermoleophilaceae bacterium]
MDLRTGGQPGTGGQAPAGGGTNDAVGWRRARLRRAGFGPALTEELSHECAVDLHALIGLVERGCPPPLAARIMAPFDHERRPC